nr:hypothetical protein EDGQKNGF_EDGQKNGF_CDS_0003 [Microvirus sp.]
MRSNVTRRININLTEDTEKYLEFLKARYTERYGKTTEADIIRDAIEAYTHSSIWDYDEKKERKYPVFIKE